MSVYEFGKKAVSNIITPTSIVNSTMFFSNGDFHTLMSISNAKGVLTNCAISPSTGIARLRITLDGVQTILIDITAGREGGLLNPNYIGGYPPQNKISAKGILSNSNKGYPNVSGLEENVFLTMPIPFINSCLIESNVTGTQFVEYVTTNFNIEYGISS